MLKKKKVLAQKLAHMNHGPKSALNPSDKTSKQADLN